MLTKFNLFAVLVMLSMASLNAQTISYPAGCTPPEISNLPFDHPKIYGAIEVDGVDAPVGDVVGVYNTAGELVGRGTTVAQNTPSGSFVGTLIYLQTDGSNPACASFSLGDTITMKLENAPSDNLQAINSTFKVLLGTAGIAIGPDEIGGDIDIFNFESRFLPITLTDFSARPVNSNVDLSWSTSSETNNDFFEVQRSNNPEAGFEAIGKVVGNGTTTTTTNYEFTDENPAEGINYYRLEQFDYDGTSEVSPIVLVEMAVSAQRSVAVFPNPLKAGGRMTVRLNGNWAEGATQLTLVDGTGRIVSEWTGRSNGSLNTDLPVVKAGVYQLIATDGKERRVTRLMVK
jgi:hypothetical protein